jgi:hypothetical protein
MTSMSNMTRPSFLQRPRSYARFRIHSSAASPSTRLYSDEPSDGAFGSMFVPPSRRVRRDGSERARGGTLRLGSAAATCGSGSPHEPNGHAASPCGAIGPSRKP